MGLGKAEEMAELKKCPFCGGKAELYKSFDYVNKYKVECAKCEMCSPNYNKSEEAIKAWNRRVGE